MERHDHDTPGDRPRVGAKIAAATALTAVVVALGAAQVAGMNDPAGSGCAGSPLGQQGEGC